jgi:hypothetical protein
MKTRFTAADVAAQVACLRARCLGHRVANVYDLNPRTYLLKLHQSGTEAAAAAAVAAEDAGTGAAGAAEEDASAVKTLLLLESGTRFHTTQYMRDKARAWEGASAGWALPRTR